MENRQNEDYSWLVEFSGVKKQGDVLGVMEDADVMLAAGCHFSYGCAYRFCSAIDLDYQMIES